MNQHNKSSICGGAMLRVHSAFLTARALADDEKMPLSRPHLETVIDLNKEFQKDYGRIEKSRHFA